MAKEEQNKIDYPTFLSYMDELGIKVYDMNQVNCQFSRDEVISKGGSTIVYRGLLNDSDIPASDAIPVALKAPPVEINESTTDFKVSDALNDCWQEIRTLKHTDGHPNIIKF